MSKLLKLKEWFTLEDAAKHISTVLGEAVSVVDVVQFCTERRMRASIYLIRALPARECEVFGNFLKNSKEGRPIVDNPMNFHYLAYDDLEGDFIVGVPSESSDMQFWINGLFDLVLDHEVLEKKYLELMGFEPENESRGDLVILRRTEKNHRGIESFSYFALEDIKWTGLEAEIFPRLTFEPVKNMHGAIFVIRTSELLRFEVALINDPLNQYLRLEQAAALLAQELWGDCRDRDAMIAFLSAGDSPYIRSSLEDADDEYLRECLKLRAERQYQEAIYALLKEGALNLAQSEGMLATTNKVGALVLRSELVQAIKNWKPTAPTAPSTGGSLQSDEVTGSKVNTQSNGITPQPEPLATPAQLIAAFGAFTDMSDAWFGNLNDKPALKAARKVAGVAGRNSKPALFCPYLVMTWLINPKRKAGRSLSEATGWRMLKQHFNDAYLQYENLAPLDD